MSKKVEKESTKQKEKEVNPKTEQQEKNVSEVSELKEQKDTVQAEDEDLGLKKLQDEIIRLKNALAESENKRKDLQRSMEYLYKYGGKRLASLIVNFLIDLEERALKEMKNDLQDNHKSKKQDQELVERFKDHLMGMEIIKDNLKRSLENEGVKEIKVKVEEDRANIRHHELIEKVENDNLPEGTVIEVVKKGYFFHEEVLQPVKVKIAKKSKKD